MTKKLSRKYSKGAGISIIVPFHCPSSGNQRAKNWKWLRKYWECSLPEAQIIMARDHKADKDTPFSKSAAVNNGVSRASGDILVIVDADGFVPADSILLCAEKIRRARTRSHRLWFVPYRRFYRLTEDASQKLLKSNPCHPYVFPNPPANKDIQNSEGSQFGHWWGAGIQIIPREGFDEVGGWDERFRGWGGEDHAAMRAADTLYWPHKTLPGQFLHVWHPMFNPDSETKQWVDWSYRVWAGQTKAGANDKLSARYYGAQGHPKRMRKLVGEGQPSHKA